MDIKVIHTPMVAVYSPLGIMGTVKTKWYLVLYYRLVSLAILLLQAILFALAFTMVVHADKVSRLIIELYNGVL